MRNRSLLGIFFLVGVFVTILHIDIMIHKKLPFSHDTFQYFQQQYVYFNEFITQRSIPLWFPFVSQGFVGNFHITGQLTMALPVQYLVGILFPDINYYYLFHLGIWIEEMFFLLGVILLSSFYYKNKKTILFTAITLLGTNIWYPQIWWNFHLFYWMPLTLYGVHRFLKEQKISYLILASLTFSLTVLGNFIYCIIFALFILTIYYTLYACFHWKEILVADWKKIPIKHYLSFLLILCVLAISFLFITVAIDQIDYLQQNRNTTGKNTLQTFMTYGGSLGLHKYREILRRYSSPENITRDINLFAGFFLIPFAAFTAFYCRKKISYVIAATALVVFFFSIGSWISVLFYYLFPGGSFFRHIGLTAPVFKVLLVFYAGFGFEEFCQRVSSSRTPILVLLLSQIILLGWLLYKPWFPPQEYFFNIVSPENRKLLKMTLYGILSLNVVVLSWFFLRKMPKNFLIYLLLGLVSLDMFTYKYSLIPLRMPKASPVLLELFKPYRYEFPPTRLMNTNMAVEDNQRLQSFYSTPFTGARYNTIESFLFIDSAISPFRSDFLLKPLKKYFEMIQTYPNKNGAYEKYSGIDYPKLSVFSKLHIFPGEKEIGTVLANPVFEGNVLFALQNDFAPLEFPDKPEATEYFNQNNSPLFTYERIPALISIKQFSYNTLKLDVTTEINQKNYFLYYADVFHPYWTAIVNGKKTPVIRANIAYKAIPIPSGIANVEFRFSDLRYRISAWTQITVILALLGSCIFIFWRKLVVEKN